MNKAITLAGAAILGATLLSGGAWAQGAAQTVELAKVDVRTLAAGYRASKTIGTDVVNEAGETIGKVDDVLVSSDGKQPYAVLSIGSFLGMGAHLVVVRYEALRIGEKTITLPNGTKEGLKMLPQFKYATD